MVVFLGLHLLVPILLQSWSSYSSLRSFELEFLAESLANSCLSYQLDHMLETTYRFSLFTPQVLTNLLGGLLCFLLSWWIFPFALREPTKEMASRGLVRKTAALKKHRVFSSGRASRRFPFVWKDFYFVAGGVPLFIIRILGYLGLFFVFLGYSCLSNPWLSNTGWVFAVSEATDLYLGTLLIAIPLDVALLVAKSLNLEVRGQTLATLFTLPRKNWTILYTKIVGTLLACLPGPFWLMLTLLCMPQGPVWVQRIIEFPGACLWLIAHLVLLVHVAAVASLYLRWGALPVAISVCVASIFLSITLFRSIQADENHPLVFAVAVGLTFISLLCHPFIGWKARQLARR